MGAEDVFFTGGVKIDQPARICSQPIVKKQELTLVPDSGKKRATEYHSNLDLD
jgi:hypothetical protein